MSKRWMFIPLGMLINMCLGAVYAWSVFKKPLEKLLSIGATESGIPFMLFLAFFAVTMPVVGKMIDRIGPRKIIIIGGAIVASGWILSSFAKNIIWISITYGVIAGSGVGVVYGVPLSVVAKWFPDRKGLALGLTLLGFGFSPFVTAPLSRALIEMSGPFVTFRILGIAFLVVITLCALPLRFPKEEEIKGIGGKAGAGVKAVDMNLKEALKTKQFYGLWITYTIGTLAGLMAILITSPVGQEVIKLDAKTAAFMVSIFAIFNGIGRPIFGYLTDKIGIKISAVISYVLMIAASALILVSGEGKTWLYILSFASFWMILGGWLAIAPSATTAFFGLKNYSQNYGFIFTAYGAGAILGTILSGVIRDKMGSYIFSFYPIIGLAIIGMAVALFTFKNEK